MQKIQLLIVVLLVLIGIGTPLAGFPMEKEDFTKNESPSAIGNRSSTEEVEENRATQREMQESQEEEPELRQPTLDDFRDAVASYPTSLRFFLYEEEESGQQTLKAEVTNKSSSEETNKGENLEVISLLRRLVYEKYPAIETEDLFPSDLRENNNPSLNAHKLRTLFNRVDQEERKRFQNNDLENSLIIGAREQEAFLLGDHDAIIAEEKAKMGALLQEMIIDSLQKTTLSHGDEEKSSLEENETRKFLHPPLTSFDEEEWHHWASSLIQAGKNDPAQADLIADYGLSDPIWVISQLKIALARAATSIKLEEESILGPTTLRLPNHYSSENLTREKLPLQKRLSLPLQEALDSDQQESLQPQPPLPLHKAQEVTGKALLRRMRSLLALSPPTREQPLPTPIIPIIDKPTEDDLLRWNVYQEYKRLEDERERLLTKTRGTRPPFSPSPTSSSKIFRFASPLPSQETTSSVQKTVRENDHESTITTPSKRTHLSGSIYTRTTASTQSGKSDLSTAEEKLLKPINKQLTQQADQWIKLVLQADTKRKAKGGLAYEPNEALFTAWEKADTQAQKNQQEQQRVQEAFATRKRLEENWEANTRRWEARDKADVLRKEQELVEKNHLRLSEDAQKAEEDWASLALPVILRHLTGEGLAEGNNLEPIFSAPHSNAMEKSSLGIKLLRAAIDKEQLLLQKKELKSEWEKSKNNQHDIEERRDHQNRLWLEEYEESKKNHSSLKKLLKKTQSALEHADQDLKTLMSSAQVEATSHTSASFIEAFVTIAIRQFHKDQAVNERWRAFSNPAIIEQEETALHQETTEAHERGIHQVELVTTLNQLRERCFEKIPGAEEKLSRAYAKYQSSHDALSREELEHLCRDIDQLDAEGEEHYLEGIVAQALEDAHQQGRKALPVWASYIQKNQQASLETPSVAPLPSPRETVIFVASTAKESPLGSTFPIPIDSLTIDPLKEGEGAETKEPTQKQLEQDIKNNILKGALLDVALETLQSSRTKEQQLQAAREAKKEADLFQQQFEEKYSAKARIAQRTKAIVNAQQKAWKVLEEEVKELNDIEIVWKTQQDEEKKLRKLHILRAAHQYYQNDPSAWSLLTQEEQQEYNDAVLEANEAKEDAIEKTILRTKKEFQELQSQDGDNEQKIAGPIDLIKDRFHQFSWKVKSASYKKAVYQKIEKAKEHLIELWAQEEERKRALHVASLLPQEREAAIHKNFSFDFYHHAQDLERRKGSLYYQKENLTTLSKEEVVNYWNEVVGRVGQLATAWQQALENNIHGKGLLLPPRDIDAVFIKDKVAFWNSELLYCHVSQAAAIAQQAQEKLFTTSHAPKEPLWRESLRTAQEAEDAFHKAYENHTAYVETSSSVTEPETQWAHWIATAESLIIDAPQGKSLLEKAVSSLTHAASHKTETAWIEAQQHSQALLTFLNQQKENTALLKIQKAIWRQKVKFAAAKASLAKAKYQWEPLSQALQNYINHPEAEVSTLDLATLKRAEHALREALEATTALSHNNLSTGESMAVVAKTAASGLAGTIEGIGVGVGAFAVAVPTVIFGTPGMVGYTAYQASSTATTAGEAARAVGLSTSALVGGALVLATAPIGALTAAGVTPLAGAALYGPRAAKKTLEAGYDDFYASGRCAEVVRSTLDAQVITAMMTVSLKALHHSFPRSYLGYLTIPTALHRQQAVESTAQAQELLIHAQGTSWAEEATWLTEITGQAAAFAIAAEAKKK